MKKFLVITQVIYALFLGVWAIVWLTSFMLFDSGVTWTSATAFGVITAYPVAALTCSITAWILRRKEKQRTSVYVNLVPSLWVVSITGVLLAANI